MSESLDHGPASEQSVTVPDDYVPIKRAEILELDMGDGFIVYNHESNLVHHLNPSASIMWQLCDGDATVKDLAQEIAEEYQLEMDRVRYEVAGLIGELDTLGLVEDARGNREG